MPMKPKGTTEPAEDEGHDLGAALHEVIVLVLELEEEWHLDDRIAYMTRNA
jgi:hypothetical protein